MPPEPFLLNVSITRLDVVEWLQTIPPDKLPQAVENTLAAGNLVLSLLQASTGEESMQRFFRPVLEPMQKLKDTIDSILRAAQKSQRLGELGEDIVIEQLKSAFPGDEFHVVSTQEHRADIHANFAISGEEARKALIEVKFYSGDVPSHEIEKFRNDLEETGFKYGLMVSLASRLTGISGQLHLEERPNCVAVYLPSAGLDGHRLVCAVALLKAILRYHVRSDIARLIPAGAIEQAWLRLNLELQELTEIGDDMRELTNSFHAAQQQLLGTFTRAVAKAISAECRLRSALQRITNRVAEELLSLPRTSGSIALLKPAEPNAVLVFLDNLRKGKDSRIGAFEALYDLSRRLGLEIRLDDNHWQFFKDEKLVACTGGAKNRLDVLVPINPDDSTRLRPALEKIKNDQIVIDGTIVERMVARLEQRLARERLGD